MVFVRFHIVKASRFEGGYWAGLQRTHQHLDSELARKHNFLGQFQLCCKLSSYVEGEEKEGLGVGRCKAVLRRCEIPVASLPDGQMQDLWLDLHDTEDELPVRHPIPGVTAGKKVVGAARNTILSVSRRKQPQLHLQVPPYRLTLATFWSALNT